MKRIFFQHQRQGRRRGVVLIIVLASLVLLTVLVLAFLGSIGTELQSSKFYANGSSLKLLAQSTVDLVAAEIRDATADGSLCWASQPGMIRTWNNAGTPLNYYKLYSDDAMVKSGIFDHTVTLVPDGTNPNAAGTVYAAWNQQKGVYVDLNQPVSVNGTNQYPILDGELSANDLTSLTFATGTGGNTTTPLPAIIKPTPTSNVNTVKVLGPVASNQPAVAGFWLNSKTPVDSTSPNQAPMPVKWLYVLQDGQIAVPDSQAAASSTVAFSGALHPTPGNPIIGRMAFWTDDETSKVNVNTASEGTYWDMPRQDGTEEGKLAFNPPTQFEFQRYPGHPAMTCLSTVFSGITPETVYALTPRLGAGGSQGGTVQTTQAKPFTAVVPNSNRLYATTDEYLFQPTVSSGTRNQNSALSGATALTPSALKKARFFITASSRAPDVNLFNQPRVSVWPISSQSGSAYRSIYDQLIAFCTTMRTDLATPYLYYFQRQDPTDPKTDLPTTQDSLGLNRNRMLLEYLRNRTAQTVPGFGGNLAAKYNAGNGSGATDNDQTLTEIFDYIRSTNLRDPSVTNPYTYQLSPGMNGSTPLPAPGMGQVIPIEDTLYNTRGFGRFRTVQGGTLLFIANADGDDANSQPATNPVAAGYMRIQMAFIPQLFDPSCGSVFDNASFDLTITGLDSLQIGTTNLGLASSISEHVAGNSADGGAWGDQFGLRSLLGSPSASPLISVSVDVPKTSGNFSFTGNANIHLQLLTPTAGAPSTAGATHPGTVVQDVQLNFPSGSFPIPALAPSNVWHYDSGPSTVSAKPANMRYFFAPPALKNKNVVSGPDIMGAGGTNEPSLGGRLSTTITTNPYGGWITSYDIVRSVTSPSDPRLIAAQKTTPLQGTANYPFALAGIGGSSSWGSSSNGVGGMHTLFTAGGQPLFGAIWGKLVAGVAYDGLTASTTVCGRNGLAYSSASPASVTKPGGRFDANYTTYDFADVFSPTTGLALNGVAMGKTTAMTASDVLGDWDNGVGNTRDGPFINKADDGDLGNHSGTTYFTPYYAWKGRAGMGSLTEGLFTPNRLIPSALMFGSLPTGVFANRPWQTLLFRPGPIGHTGLGTSTTLYTTAANGGGDQGPPYTTPPDHLLLDLFTMPVVEPYAISEPLSTAGRINMNYLIVPFNYINRDTGLRAVLKSEQVISFSDTQASGYKLAFSSSQTTCRFPVNIDSTLSQFYSRRFNNKDIFRSPSEICEIDIVPDDSSRPATENPVSAATSLTPTRKNMDAYWNSTSAGHRLTGDNSRERIYSTLYPRLTTKSNTFTIHFRVQTLKPVKGSDLLTWREGTDLVTGEYRGSQTIERYVDPNDASLPDFANPSHYSETLAPYYKFRVLSSKQFAP